MPELKSSLLIGTAISTAVLHTLIPDHWLPFVLIGRAREWSLRRTVLVSGLSTLIHIMLSLALAWGAIVAGSMAAGAIGHSLERASGVLLVVFGGLYAGWAWRKGGHFHPGGALLHQSGGHVDCSGDEGPAHPEHLHYHADGAMIGQPAGPGGFYLAVIVGLNPCVLVLPIVLAAVEQGAAAVMQVALAYGVTTGVLMVGLSALGVLAARQVRLPAIARQMEPVSGLLIALTGVVFLIVE